MKDLLRLSILATTVLSGSAAYAGFEFVPGGYGQNPLPPVQKIESMQPVVKNSLPIISAVPARIEQQPMQYGAPQNLGALPPQQTMQPQQQYQPMAPQAQYQQQPRSVLPQVQPQYQAQPLQPMQQQYASVPRPAPIDDMPGYVPPQNLVAAPAPSGVMAQALPEPSQPQEYQMYQQTGPETVVDPFQNTAVYAQPAPTAQPQTASIAPTLQAGTIPVYSEIGVYGDAYAPNTRRRGEKKSTLFSINPFPFGKSTKIEDQRGVLFGQPVTVSADGPTPLSDIVSASGPYYGPSYQPIAEPLSDNSAIAVRNLTPQPLTNNAMASATANYGGRPSPVVYDEVIGFGSDMPLPIALSQVVPSSYSFSYDNGVSLDQTVSWEGGKPWNEVLDSMLASHNLQTEIIGNTVRISQKENHSAIYTESTIIEMSPITDHSTSALRGLDSFEDAYNDSSLLIDVEYDTTIRLWTAPTNATLRRVIDTWSAEAGVEVHWTAEYDYPLQAPVSIQGTYPEAIKLLLDGFHEAQPRPVARLHPNLPDGPAVLVVETRHLIK